MKLQQHTLAALGIGARERERYGDDLRRELPPQQIDTPLRIAHFIAQVAHESALFRRVVENMNYSADGLRTVFPRYFDRAAAQAYARNPRAIGNRAYANRLGNGDEASGDGFRYRGRGLIQLTGRANYRAFGDWLGVDVVAAPELVSERYAVASAVYFWSTRKLNAIADRDDLNAVTRAINGGLNGLDDRLRLLELARAALGATAIPPATITPTHRVTASMLNIRDRPRAEPATRIGALPENLVVECLGAAGSAGWSRVRADLYGRLIEGYVASRYLARLTGARAARAITGGSSRPPEIPRVHLPAGKREITRRLDGGRAHPLGERNMPRRRGKRPAAKARELHAIVDWLDNATRAHRRYRAPRGHTYCNIYAYDFCYLANVYLPRVWWRGPALRELAAGTPVAVAYDSSVVELNANAVFDWFVDYGDDFGWSVAHDLDTLQAAANNGEVCLIVARRADPNAAGHISAVLPERPGLAARRRRDGSVVVPVESHAGTRNRLRHVSARRWWIARKFSAFTFWRHH
tara:strand:- start:612 stop:2180 length:1569 start_codon:yes stop_codon:yes gene_type:complete